MPTRVDTSLQLHELNDMLDLAEPMQPGDDMLIWSENDPYAE